MSGPRRIVCLTEEPTETLYALGEQDRIVGISGFTVRPAIARKEKPKVSAFTSAKIGEILKLEPDFVVGFSDIQAEIAGELIRRGIEVWISNHRSVDGILDYIRRLGALVGAADRADAYADELRRDLDDIARDAATLPRRPNRMVSRPIDTGAASGPDQQARGKRSVMSWLRNPLIVVPLLLVILFVIATWLGLGWQPFERGLNITIPLNENLTAQLRRLQADADRVGLVGRIALPIPVLAGLHLELRRPHIAFLLVVLVEPPQKKREPGTVPFEKGYA